MATAGLHCERVVYSSLFPPLTGDRRPSEKGKQILGWKSIIPTSKILLWRYMFDLGKRSSPINARKMKDHS